MDFTLFQADILKKETIDKVLQGVETVIDNHLIHALFK